jgi:hypothetical protein
LTAKEDKKKNNTPYVFAWYHLKSGEIYLIFEIWEFTILQVAQKGPVTRRPKPGTRPEGMGLSIAPDAKKFRGMRRT